MAELLSLARWRNLARLRNRAQPLRPHLQPTTEQTSKPLSIKFLTASCLFPSLADRCLPHTRPAGEKDSRLGKPAQCQRIADAFAYVNEIAVGGVFLRGPSP
jgi:hypothetical protein